MISINADNCLFILIIFVTLDAFCYAFTKCCPDQPDSSQPLNDNSNVPCFSYNKNFMADSLDEAMFSFPNLVSSDQSTLFSKPSTNGDGPTTGNAQAMSISSAISPTSRRISISAVTQNTGSSSECNTYDCMSCKLSILNGFLDNPNLTQSDRDSFSAERQGLILKLGTNEGFCKQNRMQRKRREAQKNKQSGKDAILKSYIQIKQKMDKNSNTINEEQASNNNTNTSLLGAVTNIGCVYKKGDALHTESQWCGLCSICWQWRKLPPEYYPNYLNEVNCDLDDDKCLSGFGECRTVTRSIDVMRKNGDQWEELTIDTIISCECQVQIGTPIHQLVSK